MSKLVDDQGRGWEQDPLGGGYVRYNHEQAKSHTQEVAEHVNLLHGQSIDDITVEQLEKEMAWAGAEGQWMYRKQLRSCLEYKKQAYVQQQERNKIEEKVKAVNRERVGDAERTRYSDHLSNLYQQGYVDLSEFEILNSKALSAKTRGELAGLLTDLPPLPAEPPAYNPSPALLPVQRSRLRQWADHPVSAVFVMVSATAFMAILAVLISWLVTVV